MNARSLTVTASDSPRRRRALFSAMAGLVLVCAAGLVGSVQALAACPNEVLREEARSVLLPQCRAYELVSPVYTADSGVQSFNGAAPGGEASTFQSVGAFAGAGSNYGLDWYVARRVEGVGWGTTWVGASGSVQGEAKGTTLSYDLGKALVRLDSLGGNGPGSAKEPELFFSGDLVAAPAFSFQGLGAFKEIPKNILGGRGNPVDESPDFSHVVVESEDQSHVNDVTVLYDLAGVGGPGEVLRPASLDPSEKLIETTQIGVGGGKGQQASKFHAVSNSGSEIFFTNELSQVSYVRVNGSRTLKLGGRFQGASENGSKAFVSVAGGALAMDVIDREPGQEAILERVPVSSGAAAGYLRSSDDGSRVYFTSEAVLAGNVNENKEKAVEGEFNLYVYDTRTKETAFIARTVPGDDLSKLLNGFAEAQVNGCPSGELGETEVAGCEAGRFLVFSTTARLTAEETGGGQNVYEYDARTGRLTRVSTGEEGYDVYANSSALKASIAVPAFGTNSSENQTELFEDGTRAVSDDGSTVVFSSSQALSPRAVNDLQPQPGPPDVYESHEGHVSLVSTGHSLTADGQPAITSSGRDIFFTSSEGILPQDSDGLLSVYDARVGGGFPAALVPAGGCNGDACQGPPSVPSLLGAPASATFSGLGNPVPAVSEPVVKAKVKPKAKGCRKGYVKRKSRCVKKPKAKRTTSNRRTK